MKRKSSSQLNGNLLVTLYFLTKMVPMFIAGVAIYLGYKLFVLGVTGQASLVVDASSLSGQLLNAAPGLFFSVGGIVALITAVWKGSTFTFSRAVPDETWAFCLPDREFRTWRYSQSREPSRKHDTPEHRSSESGDTAESSAT